MNQEYIAEVREKVRHRPRLTPIFQSTHDIPERIFEYNPRLFLCFNNVNERFEVHSLDQDFDSYCASLPYKRLDARTMRWIWENDLRVHGMNLMRKLDEGEEKYNQQKQREFKKWVEDVGKETRSMFAKDAWAAV